MPEGCLDEVDGRTAVKGVTGMRVTQPVWGYLCLQTSASSRRPDDAAH